MGVSGPARRFKFILSLVLFDCNQEKSDISLYDHSISQNQEYCHHFPFFNFSIVYLPASVISRVCWRAVAELQREEGIFTGDLYSVGQLVIKRLVVLEPCGGDSSTSTCPGLKDCLLSSCGNDIRRSFHSFEFLESCFSQAPSHAHYLGLKSPQGNKLVPTNVHPNKPYDEVLGAAQRLQGMIFVLQEVSTFSLE